MGAQQKERKNRGDGTCLAFSPSRMQHTLQRPTALSGFGAVPGPAWGKAAECVWIMMMQVLAGVQMRAGD